MNREVVEVSEVTPGGVWVKTSRQTACGSCSARAGCGQHALSQLGRPVSLWVSTDLPLKIGQQVTISLPKGGVALSALMLYGLPLIGVLLGAMLGQPWGDGAALVGALIAMIAGFILSRTLSWRYRKQWQPTVLPSCERSHSTATILTTDR